MMERDLFPLTTEFEGCLDTYSSEIEFKENLTTECLSMECNRSKGYVFWSPDTDDAECESSTSTIFTGGRSIREKIRCFLISTVIHNSCYCAMDLVQFWAPKEVEGRTILTTLHQPFAVGFHLFKGLSWHRKRCMEHQYTVFPRADGEQLGPPGMVFRNGHPESSPDIRVYSAKVFPLQDHAANCGVKSYLALPIFGLQSNQCIGVLEIFGTGHGSIFHFGSTSNFCKLLELTGLRTADKIDVGETTSLGVVDYDQLSFGGMGKIFELSLNGNDESYTISGYEENLQIPETDYLKNIEQQENIIDRNSGEGKMSDKSTACFNISRKDLEAQFGQKQEIAAVNCGVSKSTLKRACKKFGVQRWPSNAKNKTNSSLFKTKTSQKPVQIYEHQISKSSSSNLQISDFPVNSNVPYTCTESSQEVDKTRQETNVVMIRAKFKKETVKFVLRSSSGLKGVEEEVVERFNVMIGNFTLKYKDDYGYMISLKCEEDLHLYVKSMQLPGNTTDPVLQVHLVSS